jgi:hypothetical protein
MFGLVLLVAGLFWLVGRFFEPFFKIDKRRSSDELS